MLLIVCKASAQHAIEGSVRQASDGRPLAGATVQVKGLPRIVSTDEFGFFRIDKLKEGTVELVVRFVGFEEVTQSVTVPASEPVEIRMNESSILTDEVVVSATRAGDKTPSTYSNVSGTSIRKQNFGQDLPFLLNWTPSVVTTSDAGAGIGYTGIRIRGSDATRVNVTINGIPYNDSESQGTFWVDIPDIASSTQSVQIQRGVGTSTNGAGAFGASINLQTNSLVTDPYTEIVAAAGSFGSQRYTVKAGTGLMDDHWSFDVKLSSIRSDGYIERASSDLGSYYFSAGYRAKNTVIKAITFGGTERTYQAWYGVDPVTMETNRRMNFAGAIYNPDGSIARYYENQVDDYRQDHYQLHVSQQLNNHWNANVSLHFTHGRGFYEEYHQGMAFSDLGLPPLTLKDTTLNTTDAVVRKWLDNNFYGGTFALHYDGEKSHVTVGGAFNQYGHARHFGDIQWMQYAGNVPPGYEYYRGESTKNDFNVYTKWTYQLTPSINTFADAQLRLVNYKTRGVRDDQTAYDVQDDFTFFNPKAGVNWVITPKTSAYISYAIAHREPNRSDYLDGTTKPRAETLGNLEAGYRLRGGRFIFEGNYYLMNYTDQLVLTGQLDNAGYPIRANVGSSYRTGVELTGAFKVTQRLNWGINTTLSANHNENKKNIILSPSVIAGSQLSWSAFAGLEATWMSKYVGTQFLDNTERAELSLAAYWVNDLRLSYSFAPLHLKEMQLSLLINNLFDTMYISNGYVYYDVPYYYPQAGRNFMAMISLRL